MLYLSYTCLLLPVLVDDAAAAAVVLLVVWVDYHMVLFAHV